MWGDVEDLDPVIDEGIPISAHPAAPTAADRPDVAAAAHALPPESFVYFPVTVSSL